MAAAENKPVVSTFVEEVILQDRLERVNHLVAPDFVELDLSLASSRARRS
jgi:hypothetical protein